MKYYDGAITEFDESTGAVKVGFKVDLGTFLRQQPKTVRVAIVDGRGITDKQRRMIYALLRYIADWEGESPDIVKKQFKLKFRVDEMRGMFEDFSLSDAPESLASDFLKYIIEFIIEHRIPCDRPLVEYVEDIKHYVYSCLIHKVCAVCGRKAELHHIDAVGMGNDRTKIEHIGRRSLPLCSKCHELMHKLGTREFIELYHLTDEVEIDDEIKKTYKLRGGQK